jgi:hypothetical protein
MKFQHRIWNWLAPVCALLGLAFLALAVWIWVSAGSPRWARGEQPIEVVGSIGLGLALLINGLVLSWRALKKKIEGVDRDED